MPQFPGSEERRRAQPAPSRFPFLSLSSHSPRAVEESTGIQTCSLQGKQPGSNPAPAQSQRPPQVPAVPSPTAWGPEGQRRARHTTALLGGRPHLVPLDFARPRGKREVPKEHGGLCLLLWYAAARSGGQGKFSSRPRTGMTCRWDATSSTSTLQGSPPALGTPSPPCLTCCLVRFPPDAQHSTD